MWISLTKKKKKTVFLAYNRFHRSDGRLAVYPIYNPPSRGYELDATEVARNEEGADEDRPRRPVFPDEDRVQT